MTKRDATRREFLVRAAVSAGTAASAGLVPAALAQAPDEPKAGGDSSTAQNHAGEIQQGAFFNYEDAATVAALTERLMPGAPGKAGAGDADVLNYIDLALAGAYADLQDFYRRGLAHLDAHCRKHTMEGMFADPIYGGNKDFAGWRLVNFPGIQAVFTPADMESKQAFTRAPLIGLQTKAPMRMG
jgi:gluconate 2-dehydrogenase gamma chain